MDVGDLGSAGKEPSDVVSEVFGDPQVPQAFGLSFELDSSILG